MNKMDYTQLITDYFDDKTKYRRLTFDPTNKLQTRNNNIVKHLFDNKYISRTTKKQLRTTTAQPPRPEATPKLHKPGTRIIINATNCPAYKMSRFLNQILTKAVTDNRFNIKNSFELKTKIDTIQLHPEDIMVSFDIVSMYEKIPLKNGIRIGLQKME